MDEGLKEAVEKEIRTLDSARELMPIWTDWGVEDRGVWIHSLGCAFWTSLGGRLGLVALTEAPAPELGQYASIGEGVRSDSIWFDRASREARLLLEFERYGGAVDAEKLAGKVKRLLLAHHRWGERADLLVLAYWTKGLASLPEHRDLACIFREGFETGVGERVFGSARGQLIFYQFVMREGRDGRLYLSEIIRRGEQ